MAVTFEVPEPVRRKALAEGEAGRAWLTNLGDLVAELAADWKLVFGRTLTGGTEALILAARTAEGRDAVLKVNLPARDPAGSQLSTLLAARGRGYAEVPGTRCEGRCCWSRWPSRTRRWPTSAPLRTWAP